jgi:hypothetical protein
MIIDICLCCLSLSLSSVYFTCVTSVAIEIYASVYELALLFSIAGLVGGGKRKKTLRESPFVTHIRTT